MPRLLTAAAISLLLWGCSPREVSAGAPAPPHLIVITLDTVRADHLGCYGYSRNTTPHLDSLAAESLLFEQCVAPMAQTLASHTTLFTGMQPEEHGVLANRREDTVYVPAPGARTLAEVLSEAGFHTAAFVAATPVKRGGGLERGFQSWWEPEAYEAVAEDVIDQALDWIGPGLEQPSLLWVHLFDAHGLYQAPAPYGDRYQAGEGLDPLFKKLRVSREGSAGQVREVVFDSYDGELAYVDAQVGRLLDHLRATGDLDRAVLVITADHGEGLLQHGRGGHAWVWREQHHVPFLLRGPNLAPGRRRTPLALRDVLPTALTVSDPLRAAAEPWLAQASGQSYLLPAEAAPIFSRLPAGARRPVQMVEFGGWRLIAGLPRPRLFDLSRDPHELINRAERDPEKLEELQRLLADEAQRARVRGERLGAGQVRPMTASREEGLEALGYTGEVEPR
jgi:arylsulfatase A-like enzyme